MEQSGWWNLSMGLVILWKSCDLTELKKKECVVDFVNEQRYCRCTLHDFKITRVMYKHFFAVIEGNHRTFNNISKLFRIAILFR